MNITFIGHVSKDVNVVEGKRITIPGGGVYFGSIAAQVLGENVEVYTKCAEEDRRLFEDMVKVGANVHFLPSSSTTSIENFYPSSNPDERQSKVISLADKFVEDDFENVASEVIHINSLWYGEVSENLIPFLKEKTEFLGGDAQGFLRKIEKGDMVYSDWHLKEEYLGYFDFFKVDSRELKILTRTDNIKEGLKKMRDMGVTLILATHREGVTVYDGKDFYDAKFGKWKLEGRTGRGDTCAAAFLVAMTKMNLKEATEFAANVTSRKMRYPGPYKG